MLVYGDLASRVCVAEALADLATDLRRAAESQGRERRERLARAFVEASGLMQGLIDAEFEASGADDLTPLHAAAMDVLLGLARGDASSNPLAALRALPLAPSVSVTTPEGYAFYAVYPQAYAAAATAWPWTAPPLVIGVRSIGTSLAAVVGATAGARTVVTVRPGGHPFARELRLSPALRARFAEHRGPFAVVDEGPGLSGSSFGCVADLLEELGVGAERIVFFPSHTGDLGPKASPRHRARWRTARRSVRTLDDLLRDEPIGAWFEDIVGREAEVEDLSAGAWRDAAFAGRAPPPADPPRERRKFRLTSGEGRWLAKFAGLGAIGEAKFARAEALHGEGFAPEPIALRNGFLLQRWEAGEPLAAGAAPPGFVDHLARYLAFRAQRFPAREDQGASIEALIRMAQANTAELIDGAAADALGRRLRDQAASRCGPRVQVDARLHPWEWLRRSDGSFCKLDALDHSRAHDLIGCQPIAWDVAGAAVEFELSAGEVERLQAAVNTPVDRGAVMFFRGCYAAFQGGLWAMAHDSAEAAERPAIARQLRLYRAELMRVVAGTKAPAPQFSPGQGGPRGSGPTET